MGLWRALVGQFSGLDRPLVELPPEALMQARTVQLLCNGRLHTDVGSTDSRFDAESSSAAQTSQLMHWLRHDTD